MTVQETATTPVELVVLDVETTGIKPEEGHRVIEVAGQRLRGSEILGSYSALVRIDRALDPDVVAIHGITTAMLEAEGQPAAEVFSQFRSFVDGAVLVGHNIEFDLGFLNAELKLLQLPELTNETLDTIVLAKKYLILASYSLKNVAAYMKVPQPTAHRAMADVETTREVLFKLIERAKQTGS